VRLREPTKAKKRPNTHRRASPCHGRPSPEGRRSAPTTDTMSPVPPATSPLPPATPTTVTATHVAMRADHHRLRRLRRLGNSRRDTPADHCKTGDGNYRARISARKLRRSMLSLRFLPCWNTFSVDEYLSVNSQRIWERNRAVSESRPVPSSWPMTGAGVQNPRMVL
jgi:hypothetical protein